MALDPQQSPADPDDLFNEKVYRSIAYTPGIFSGNLGELVDPRGDMHTRQHDLEGFFAINNGAWESGDGDGMYFAPMQGIGGVSNVNQSPS